MTVLRCVLTGAVAAILTSVLWTLGTIAVVMMRFQAVAVNGSGGLAAVSTGAMEPLFFVAPLSFLVGFSWRWRRRGR